MQLAKRRPVFRHFILVCALFITAAPSAAHAGCMEWLAGRVREVFNPTTELDARFERMREILSSLQVADTSAMKPIGYLGAGVSGYMMKVEIEGRAYALKLFHTKRRNTGWLGQLRYQEQNDAVIIQQFLGELGLAPKIYGVLSAEQVRTWFAHHSAEYEKVLQQNTIADTKDFNFGLLMELVEGVHGKSLLESDDLTPTGLSFTAGQAKEIMDRAREIDRVLYKHRIAAYDLDLALDKDGQLKLIDLSYYLRSKSRFVGPIPNATLGAVEELLLDLRIGISK